MPSKEHYHPPIADTMFPHGFLATGLHVGVKENKSTEPLAEGPKDVAVIVSTTERTSSAGTFTRNVFKAAPVQVSAEVLRGTQGRANKLVLNSGCANAVTGTKGMADAWYMAQAADEAFSTLSSAAWHTGNSERSSSTLVMSTGVIGQLLPINKILEGIKSAAAGMTAAIGSTGSDTKLRSGFKHWERAARAFMTTDTFPKLRARTFTLPPITSSDSPATFRMAGIDKGAGMIHPNMGPLHATLLGLIVTDVPITPRSLQNALTYAIDRSFNSISVDGDMSTNDTVIAFANGAAVDPGVEEIDEDKHPEAFLAFRNELTSFAIDLAKLIIYDGEGATKFITVTVKVRRLVFRCNVLTLRLNKERPNLWTRPPRCIDGFNVVTGKVCPLWRGCQVSWYVHPFEFLGLILSSWGRILCAVGYSPLKTSTITSSEPLTIDPSRVSVTFLPADASAPLRVLVEGEPEIMDEARASEVVSQSEITIEIDLGMGKESATYWTCDLSHVSLSSCVLFRR